MRALLICENLIRAISNREIVRGQVHSIFHNACNIETEHELVTLLSRQKAMGPMSMVLGSDSRINFTELGIAKKMDFNFSLDGIICEENNLFIGLKDATIWHPGVILKAANLPEAVVLKNIKTMEKVLNVYGKLYGIGPLVGMLEEEIPDLGLFSLQVSLPDKSFDFIRHRFLSFIQAVIRGNMERAARKAACIIGFGAGLTPAVDDFICGLMVSFIYLGYFYNLDIPAIFKFNRALILGGLEKTTKVSAKMLKHSAVGETNQSVRDLMLAVLYQQDEEKVKERLINTVDIGETSGSDTALGIYTGCKIMTNYKYREVWSNETMFKCQEG